METTMIGPARLWLGGASAAALLAVLPAPSLAAQATASQAAPPHDVEELVVTARRREERLQDVPQSVTSVSGVALTAAGVTDTSAINQVTPGLNMPSSGTNIQPMIRGIGTTNSAVGDEPNVAIYLDGVYQATPTANTFALTSIERVEILRGPQGTLFGRNSAGGAINIITKSPSRDFHGEITLGVGTHERASLSTYLTGPLGGGVSADLAIGYEAGGGVYRNIFTNTTVGAYRNLIVRPKVRIDITDDATLTLGALFDYNSDPRANVYGVANGNVSYRATPAGAALPVPSRPRETATNFEPKNTVWDYQAYAKLELDFENLAVSSQTSLTRTLNHNYSDTDYGPLNLATNTVRSSIDTIQQEFLFNSVGESNFEWVAGLFLYRADAKYRPRRVGTGGASINATLIYSDTSSTMDTSSYAPFGELTWRLSDRLSVTGGARYTYERKELRGSTSAAPATTVYPAESWKSFTPRAVLRYEIPDTVNMYASVSQGFKSGTYFTATIPPAPPVSPEKLTAYEVGVKTLLPSRWSAAGAVYFNKYEDIQVLAFQFPAAILLNAAEGESYGFESEVSWRATDELRVRAFVSYTHTEYTSFPGAIVLIRTPGVAGGNTTLRGVDVSGARFLRAPDWLAGANFIYEKELGAGDLSFTGSYYYNGGYSLEITNRNRQKAYSVVNASIGWAPKGSPLKLTLWATNLTNSNIYFTGNSSAFGDNAINGAPRTIGARVSASFP